MLEALGAELVEDRAVVGIARLNHTAEHLAVGGALARGFVGRGQELRWLGNEWGEGAARFRAVLLTGPRGIGKSSLAAAFADQLRPQQALVLTARASDLGANSPYRLWVDALQHIASTEIPGPGQDTAPGLREALTSAITKLTGRARVCMVFDDSHLADPWSWELLSALAAHPGAGGLFVVVCGARHHLFDHPHACSALTDLEDRDLLRRLELGPLPSAAIGGLLQTLVGTPADPESARQLRDRTRGNAFLTVRLLRGIHHLEPGTPPSFDELPAAVLDGIRSWLTGRPPIGIRVLETLAVSSPGLVLGDLARVAGLGVDEFADQLHDLVESGLISESRQGVHWHYRLAYPILADAVYATLGGARRALTHRDIGRALLARGDVAACAQHLIEGADAGDDDVIAMLLDALHRADRYDTYRQGLELLGALRDLLPHGDDRWASVAEALAGWAFSHHVNGDARLAIAALREIEMIGGDDVSAVRRAEVKTRLAVLLAWSVGDLAAAEKAAHEAIELYETEAMASHALFARVELAYIQGLRGDIPAMTHLSKAVLADAEEAADVAVAESALGVYATATFFQGHFAASDEAFDRALALSRRSGSPNRLARNLTNRAWTSIYRGQLASALTALEQARIAMPWWTESNLSDVEAGVRWLAGDLTGATNCLADRDWSHPTLRRGMGLGYLVLAHVERSETQKAHQALKVAEKLYRESNWFITTGQYHHAAGMFAWHESNRDDAMHLLTLGARQLLTIGAPMLALPVLLDQVELACETEAIDVAIEAAATVRRLADDSAQPFHHALAALATAHTGLATRDDPKETLTNAVRARDELRNLGLTLLHGRATLAVAQALKELSRTSDTITTLRDAASIFHECGATWRRDCVADELRQTNESGRRAAAQVLGPETLTQRELEVAKLAAQRLPAREIAERLFVSRRTVESHIASIYNKLGVHSKAELAQTLRLNPHHSV